MRKVGFYVVFFLLLIIYIYSIVFKIVPISSKIFLELFGLFYCLRYFNNRYILKREYVAIIRLIFVIVLWDSFTCIVNGSYAFQLTKDIVPLLGSIFVSQYLYDIAKRHAVKTEGFMFFVIITIFLESILTIVMKLIPPIYEIVSEVLIFELGKKEGISDIFELARFYGIGNAIYFGVLPSCTLGVITSVYMIKSVNNAKLSLITAFMLVVIGITSFFVARMSLAIIAVAVCLWFVYSFKGGLGTTIKYSLLLIIVLMMAYPLVSSFLLSNEELSKWVYGFILEENYDTGTAGNVKNWWLNTSFSLKTFLIGDAQYVDPKGGYYMHVDIGFFRQIFYGGIVGLFLNLYLHARILKGIYYKEKTYEMKYMLIALFLCYLVILAKGDTHMSSYYMLYLVLYTGGVYIRKQRQNIITVNR